MGCENEDRHWKIITLVCDPLARNFCSFFQSFDEFLSELAKEYRTGQKAMEDGIELLVVLFIDKFDHDMPLRWFDA